MRSPKIFISYSHDSEAHKEGVLALADQLRQDGVDAVIDRYEAAPAHGWAHWMHEQVANADFVLMVCTEIYHRRLMKQEQPGMGLGGAWEGNLIVTSFYLAGAISTKFVPVLFSHADAHWVPLPFGAVNRYALEERPRRPASLISADLAIEAPAAAAREANPSQASPPAADRSRNARKLCGNSRSWRRIEETLQGRWSWRSSCYRHPMPAAATKTAWKYSRKPLIEICWRKTMSRHAITPAELWSFSTRCAPMTSLPTSQRRSSMSFGPCLRHLGDSEAAALEYRAGLKVAEMIGDAIAIYRLRGNLGLVLVDQGRFDEALSLLRAVANDLRESQDYGLAGHALFNVAYTLYRSGDRQAALREADTALALLDMIVDPMAEEVRRQVAGWAE